MSIVVDANGDDPAAGRNMRVVYCSRRWWRRTGSWPQQERCLL
ncbi:hypothetical protein [Klebsiella grimontii]|nr:hypothetical protein [Klebsiella grimontii]